jgi:hypothetical protein
MTDLSSASVIKAKGLLFLLTGLLSATLLLIEHPTVKAALLLALSIWCFCRFYYFAFYVVQRYVDPGFRFSGLWSFARYLVRRRRTSAGGSATARSSARPSLGHLDRP